MLNVGNASGATVVQIYASAAPGVTLGVTRNERWLVGYTKLSLAAGKQAAAEVVVDADDLGRYDNAKRSWVVDPGEYSLFAQECAGSRWDGYLFDVKPIPNPPTAATASRRSSVKPTWEGVGCAMMGSTNVIVE